ncbi:MAG: polyhydroxyalkanoate synthesis repressor PhaR [Gammaproteobacteria bacterium]
MALVKETNISEYSKLAAVIIGATMNQPRIIKKYPNRRLYDTTISQYITLDEVKALVLSHTPFKIVDARTDEDMTTYVLLQIISEQEGGSTPIFTREILQNIIRFYGNPLQKMMSEFLEKTFSSFNDPQSQFQEYFKQTPLETMAELTKRNMAIWQTAVSDYFNKSTQQNQSNTSKKTSKKS